MAGRMQGGYPSPAPVQRPGNNGLLLWSLVGCGVIVLLGVVIAGLSLSKVVKGAGAKGMFNVMGEVEPAAKGVQKVEAALENYEKDHKGQYPPTLDALVPKYVSDKSAFVCGDGEKPIPMEYTAPKSDAEAGAVVIRVHLGDISIIPTQVQKMYVCLLKNGQVISQQDARTVLPKYSKDTAESSRTY